MKRWRVLNARKMSANNAKHGVVKGDVSIFPGIAK